MTKPNLDKHLSDKELMELSDEIIKAHVECVRVIQHRMHENGVCEGDFLNVLMTVAVKVGVACIAHLETASDMPKQKIINMVIGSIVEKAGCEFISINVPHRTSNVATTH